MHPIHSSIRSVALRYTCPSNHARTHAPSYCLFGSGLLHMYEWSRLANGLAEGADLVDLVPLECNLDLLQVGVCVRVYVWADLVDLVPLDCNLDLLQVRVGV